jgi:putative transposase
LRQVDVLTSQGKNVAEAIRSIGVSEVTYYLYGRLSHCKTAVNGFSDPWQTYTGVTGFCRSAQMGNPHTRTSTAGRPGRPR